MAHLRFTGPEPAADVVDDGPDLSNNTLLPLQLTNPVSQKAEHFYFTFH